MRLIYVFLQGALGKKGVRQVEYKNIPAHAAYSHRRTGKTELGGGGRHLFARKSQKNFLKKKSPNVAKKFFPEFWAFFARKFCPKIFSYYKNFGHFAWKIYFWGGCRPPRPLGSYAYECL